MKKTKTPFTRTLQTITLCLLIFCQTAGAMSKPAPSNPQPKKQSELTFKDGDVVCFVGDSITHSGRYHQYIYNYYATRFPDRKIKIYNCGIGGHTAEKTLVNFSWDVPRLNPTKIVLMLGMNDFAHKPWTQQISDNYAQNMIKLLELIRTKTSAEIILVTTTPYDDTAKLQAPVPENHIDYNSSLRRAAVIVTRLADEKELKLVCFHEPMTALNQEIQAADPDFTLISSDRIHPGPTGNLFMAYLFLKSQNAPAMVSETTVYFNNPNLTKTRNCTVQNTDFDKDRLTFTLTENSLPWYIDPAANNALDLVPVMDELNRQTLTVKNLTQGTWRLTIDDIYIDDFTENRLARGVNLSEYTNTPQYLQAETVMNLIEQKNALEYKLRTEGMLKVALKRCGIQFDGTDRRDINQMFNSPKVRSLFQPGGQFAKGGTLRYWNRHKNDIETIHQIPTRIEKIITEIYRENKPSPHKYNLKKIN